MTVKVLDAKVMSVLSRKISVVGKKGKLQLVGSNYLFSLCYGGIYQKL